MTSREDGKSTSKAQFRAMSSSESPSPVQITMVVRDPEGEVNQGTFARALIKIGKIESCHLMLEQTEVSRQHAIIEVEISKPVTLIDLGSDSGTFVNGKRINKAELREGDKIRIGGFQIMIAEIAGSD